MDSCLILNVGSSSLKWTALGEGDQTLAAGNEQLTAPEEPALRALVQKIMARAPRCSAVGHRIVHGGSLFQASARIDDAARSKLEDLVELDPLHMRPALAVLDAARQVLPDVPHVAAFDTAFHRTLSPAAAGYALPHEWTQRWSLRRFGFHGLSVEWSAERAGRYYSKLPSRVLVVHLGSGCSITAVRDGRSIDTTMGFTPLDGLMMGTRSGAVDPGLLLYLQVQCGIDAATLQNALARESGLLGVSGISGDLRKITEAADRGHELAQLAYDRFVLYGRRSLGAMAGSLGGADALIFTGGIGEHNPEMRTAMSLALGEDLIDQKRNRDPQIGDGAVDLDAYEIGSAVLKILVVGAREDRIIARDVRRLVSAGVARG